MSLCVFEDHSRAVVVAALIAVAAVSVYPPWSHDCKMELETMGDRSWNQLEYGPLFNPPSANSLECRTSLHFSRLFLEYLFILTIVGGLLIVLKSREVP